MYLRLLINNQGRDNRDTFSVWTDYTNVWIDSNWSTSDSEGSNIDVFSFEIQDKTNSISLEASSEIILEGSDSPLTNIAFGTATRRLFGGLLTQPVRIQDGLGRVWSCSAQDWKLLLDRAVVTKDYTNKKDWFIIRDAFKEAYDDLEDTVLEKGYLGNELNLDGFGLYDDTSPLADPTQLDLGLGSAGARYPGNDIDKASFDGQSLRSLIDVIASQVGYEWTVDAFKNFWYYPVTSTEIEAPFNLSADPADDDDSSSSYDLQWREGTSGAWTTISGITSLNRTISGLSPGTLYQARVKLSAELNSEYSPIRSITTTANSNPTVTISTFNQIVAGGATISINATIADNDDSISDLEVMWTGSGTFNDDELVDVVWTAPAIQNIDQDYTLTITVTDPFGAQGIATITFTVEGTVVGTAPVFADDTGDDLTWTQNDAIMSLTVPAATGSPAPTYAVVGNLPTGISFNTGTRVLSGTPTALGSGTIRIRATNSEGSDDWTVDYSTAVAAAVPSQPTGLAATAAQGNVLLTWDDPGDSSIISYQILRRDITGGSNLAVHINSVPVGTSYTDSTDVLDSNIYSYRIKARNAQGLSLQSGFVNVTTLAAPTINTVPFFADDTGDAQDWTENEAITTLTVPVATGNPTPTYAVVGNLPAGISFNASSRVLSGTPTSTSTGTIRIRATNSEGSDDWTVIYTTSAQLSVPLFSDDTGNDQSWTQGSAITTLTVPEASGMPTPTYAVVGSLPAGISFNTTTRILSGTPTAISSGTITIRATNSAGNDDWTIDYATTATVTTSNIVTVTIPNSDWAVQSATVFWNPPNTQHISLGTELAANMQAAVFLGSIIIARNSGYTGLGIRLSDGAGGTEDSPGPEFSDQMEMSGSITLESSDGQSITVTGISDSTEPYLWTPSNVVELRTFGQNLSGLSDRSLTVTFNDNS